MPLRPRVPVYQIDHEPFSAERAGALDAVLKWIPVEVIAAYQFTLGVVPTNQASLLTWLAGCFVLLTAGWIAFATAENGKPIARRQVVLATFAFVVWVVGTQPSLIAGLISGWQPWAGSLALGIGWLILPILHGLLIRAGIRE